MLLQTVLALLVVSAATVTGAEWWELEKNAHDEAKQAIDEQKASNEKLSREVTRLSRQVMLQQFFTEERVRSEGSSGLKQTRNRNIGLKNYFSETHNGNSMAAIHDHANNIRTVGMGEFVAVINGVEFRTRHNDYRLYMPSDDNKYHKKKDIPFPKVPPEVDNKPTLAEKIEEMRLWFKAWRDQDHAVRDYRKYFKPILCYLEGAWTRPGKSVDEPFHSDRHFVDAKTWFDLQEKFRFTSYTGSKSVFENLPFLPTTIMRFVNETIPILAQWNYRISCHPLKQDVPTSKFKLVDDVATRMRLHKTYYQHLHSRAARFSLDDSGKNRPTVRTLLDDYMEEIPGKDNYPANLTDVGFGGDETALGDDMKPKNVGYYHRAYKIKRRDAMGLSYFKRGFSDEYMYAAMTSQKEIAGVEIPNKKKCKWYVATGKKWKDRVRVCEKIHQKWSWAIPLEMIYLTPLHRWNPYNLEYKGDAKSAAGKTVMKNARYGQCGKGNDTSRAYNGTNSKAYFQTPVTFFSGNEKNPDKADTSRTGGVCVLTKDGNSKVKVMSSGVRIFLPNIPGVGVLRTRYPIMPIHGEGSAVWKELNAIKEILMNPEAHKAMLWDGNTGTAQNSEWQMSPSGRGAQHTHTINLTPKEMSQLKGGRELTVVTSHAIGHEHTLKIRWNSTKKVIFYRHCGFYKGKSVSYCPDKHPRDFIALKVDDNMVA